MSLTEMAYEILNHANYVSDVQKFTIKEISLGDGNCFLHSIISSLSQPELYLTLTETYKTFVDRKDHLGLRNEIIRFVRENDDICQELREFIDRNQWNSYWNRMSRAGEWVDNLYLMATSLALNKNLLIYSDLSTKEHPFIRITGNDVCDPFCPQNTIYLGYKVDIHYQSLCPLSPNISKLLIDEVDLSRMNIEYTFLKNLLSGIALQNSFKDLIEILTEKFVLQSEYADFCILSGFLKTFTKKSVFNDFKDRKVLFTLLEAVSGILQNYPTLFCFSHRVKLIVALRSVLVIAVKYDRFFVYKDYEVILYKLLPNMAKKKGSKIVINFAKCLNFDMQDKSAFSYVSKIVAIARQTIQQLNYYERDHDFDISCKIMWAIKERLELLARSIELRLNLKDTLLSNKKKCFIEFYDCLRTFSEPELIQFYSLCQNKLGEAELANVQKMSRSFSTDFSEHWSEWQ